MTPVRGLVLAREGGTFRVATADGEVAAVLRWLVAVVARHGVGTGTVPATNSAGTTRRSGACCRSGPIRYRKCRAGRNSCAGA